MQNIITELKKHFSQTIARLREELKTIRTSHASPALLENVIIEAYGGSTTMRLMEMATITNEGPTTLCVVPFDPSTTQDVERGILKSPLGLTPSTQINKILIAIPPLSQEQRHKYAKLVGEMCEEHRQTLRGYRDDSRRKIKHLFEAKEISEDEKFRIEKQVDEESQRVHDEIEGIKKSKITEIETI